jgi:hypothetical protein
MTRTAEGFDTAGLRQAKALLEERVVPQFEFDRNYAEGVR